jgi:hypothetical protein
MPACLFELDLVVAEARADAVQAALHSDAIEDFPEKVFRAESRENVLANTLNQAVATIAKMKAKEDADADAALRREEAAALVGRVVHCAGYNLLNFTRAFSVVNRQSLWHAFCCGQPPRPRHVAIGAQLDIDGQWVGRWFICRAWICAVSWLCLSKKKSRYQLIIRSL